MLAGCSRHYWGKLHKVIDSMAMVADNKVHGSFFQGFVTWVLVLSPILQTYGWGKFDFAFILTSFAGIWAVINRTVRLRELPKYLFLYLLYWLLVHLLSASSVRDAFSLGVLKIMLVFCTFFSVIPLPLLIKAYRITVRVCIVYFIAQLFFKYVLSINLPSVFSFLPNALSVDVADLYSKSRLMERPSSLFSEPAIFAQYLVPYFCLILFDKNMPKGRVVLSTVVLVTFFLLMQSGNALFGIASSIAFFFVFRMKGGVNRTIQAALLVIVFVLLGSFFFRTEMGERLLERKDQVSINSVENLGYSNSGFERIFRGYYIYSEYSTLCKIIGNDNPEYKRDAAFRSRVGEYLSADNQEYLYCNTIQMILLNTGIVGLIIISLVFLGIWRMTNYCGRDLLFTFLVFSFFTANYFSEVMCIYILIPTLMGRCRTKEFD